MMDSVERREWLYTQSDDSVVDEIIGLEAQINALRSLVRELVTAIKESFYTGTSFYEIINRPDVKNIMEEKNDG